MVLKVNNLGKWRMLPVGDFLQLPEDRLRRVRIEVNCASPTSIECVEFPEGEAPRHTFLGVITGLEILEFVVETRCELIFTSDSDVWYFTQDGDQIAVEVLGATSFTELAVRTERNPQLEMMMFKANQNIEARFRQLAEEHAAMVAATGYDPDTGEVPDALGDGSTDGAAAEAARPADSGAATEATGAEPAAAGTAPAVPAGPTATK